MSFIQSILRFVYSFLLQRLSSKVNYSALETLFDGEVCLSYCYVCILCARARACACTHVCWWSLIFYLYVKQVTAEATRKVSEENESKEKHVKWADTVVTNDLGGRHDEASTNKPDAADATGIVEVECEDEEEDGEEDDLVNLEEDQNYGLPYGEDYGDDGYDEY